MTAATAALDDAKEARVTVTLGVDGHLMLNAAARPPDGVAAALRRHKPAIIALLSSTPSLPVTEEWLSVIGRLHPRCKPGCHCTADGWATFLNDARPWMAAGGVKAQNTSLSSRATVRRSSTGGAACCSGVVPSSTSRRRC